MKGRNVRIAVLLSALATMALASAASANPTLSRVIEALGMRW